MRLSSLRFVVLLPRASGEGQGFGRGVAALRCRLLLVDGGRPDAVCCDQLHTD